MIRGLFGFFTSMNVEGRLSHDICISVSALRGIISALSYGTCSAPSSGDEKTALSAGEGRDLVGLCPVVGAV